MTTLPVRLLGPVSVVGPTGALPLGPARQRSVLTVLLLSVGRPVPTSELIDRVWGDEPPPASDQALRSYLCRLRKIVERSPAVRLERRDGGYLAVVEDGQLDLAVFRGLGQRARAALRDGRHAAALTAFGDALRHADGPLLAGVTSSWLAEQRRLLERERHALALERNDLALAVGDPGLVVADALGRLGDEPYDERLAGQAVLGLAGVGRTAEALQVYEGVRRQLAEELGIDPGPALRDIQLRVLQGVETVGSVAGRVTGVLVSGSTPRVPRQLPPATRGFVDRKTEWQTLDQLLLPETDEPSVIVVCGPGGAGKTALAVRWAREHADRFPDGQLFVDLHGFDAGHRPMSSEGALRSLLTALGLEPAAVPTDQAEMVGAYRTILADRRVLLVADDASTADQIRRLLPPGGGSAAIVTSRSALPGLVARPGAQVISIGMLDDDAARALLTRRLGAARIEAEPDAVNRLVRHCGGLPLALAIVAGRAAALPWLPLSTLAEDLDDETRRLAALNGGEGETDLDAVIAGSVAALSASATSVLTWLAAGPRIRIRTSVVAALAHVSDRQAEEIIRELLTIHLLEPDGPRQFRIHELVRLAVRSHIAYGFDAAVDRLLSFLITESHHGGSDTDDLLAALAYAAETGRDTALCELADALERPLGSAGRWPELVAVNDRAVLAASRLDDAHHRAVALIGRGRGAIGQRDFESACADLTDALALADDLAELGLRARAHRALARLNAHQDRFDLALHHDECGLALHRQRGDVLGQAHAYNAIGWHLAHLELPAKGLESCRRGLDIFIGRDDRPGQALTQDSIGYALERLRRDPEARRAYQAGADLCRDLGWQVTLANTLQRLAGVCRRLGDTHEAAAAQTEAEVILRLTGRHILEP